MDEYGLLVFAPQQRAQVLMSLGIEVRAGSLLFDQTNKPLSCQACKVPLKDSNFGAALHGSRLHYCDNTWCMLQYMESQVGSKLPDQFSQHLSDLV